MENQKKRNRINNFFPIFFVFLISKVLFAKFDIFGVNSAFTGFFDIFIILVAASLISGLNPKSRLLAYSLFSFTIGAIILAFKSKYMVGTSVFSPISILYFIDSIFIFLIYIIVRGTKARKNSVALKRGKSVYVIIGFFAILSLFNIVNVKMSETNAMESAKKLGIFAYSISNPTLYIKADAIAKSPTTSPTLSPTGGTSVLTPTPTPAKSAVDLSGPQYFGIAKGKNIIVIQFESLQDLSVNRKLNKIEITPNLNALIKDSIYFKNGISQISMGTTSDAEFAVNTSCYPLPAESVFRTMTNRKLIGLPSLLRTGGYYTTTFHTNTASFWNRKNMYPRLGFNKWYDQSYFGTDYRGDSYGAPDYVLYKKTIPVLKKLKVPFYAQIITVSSHSPFDIPSWMKTVNFGQDVNYRFVGKYFKNINYADRQLGMFIKELKASGLYDDSLIVLYGDHFGVSEGTITKNDANYIKKNMSILSKILGRKFDDLDTFNIPILFKMPGSIDAKIVSMPAGQVDIMPTLLNLTGIKNTSGIMFGKDLLNTKDNLVGVRFYAPSGSFANNERFYFGNKFSIDFATHNKNTNSVSQNELYTIQTIKGNSDNYIRKLAIIKK